MNEILPKEKVKELKETLEIVEKIDHVLTQDELKKIIDFSKVLSNDGTDLIFTKLYDEDENIALGVVTKMIDFALKEKIPNNGIFGVLVALDIALIKVLYEAFVDPKLTKLKLPNDMAEPNEDEIRIELYTQLEKVCNYWSTIPHLGRKINPEAFQEILNNSYEEIKKRVHSLVGNTELPLSQYSINGAKIIDELDHEKVQFNEVFTNLKSLSKIEGENHFLSYLLRDNLEITDEYNLVFEGHTKALSLGYTDKAILLSLDKDSTIRELYSNLKHLRKYNTENSEELIIYTEKLIEFIRQKRNANIIPYKALAKELGITKNQAKNYAKKLLNINDKTFTNNFEDIRLLTK